MTTLRTQSCPGILACCGLTRLVGCRSPDVPRKDDGASGSAAEPDTAEADADLTVNPDATEVCDALDVDEDCDGLSDDDETSATGQLDYVPDGDGYGDETAPLEAGCDVPSGYVADTTDCDDDDASTYPGASELGAGLLSDPARNGGGAGNLALADFEFIGERIGDSAGWSVSTAGDVDGDGLDDLIVGANSHDGSSPIIKAHLILGSTLAATPSTSIDLGNADFAFIGENSGDFAGFSVSTAGDVDGDGLDDLFVGAPYNDLRGYRAGKTSLLLGSSLAASTSTSIDLGNADFAFVGENADDFAGHSVSATGDVNGDERDDLIVGASRNNGGGSTAGKAYLILRKL